MANDGYARRTHSHSQKNSKTRPKIRLSRNVDPFQSQGRLFEDARKFPGKISAKDQYNVHCNSLNRYIDNQLLRSLVGVHLERQQAVALLKEIAIHDLAQPTAVYVREIEGKFELVMKDDCSQNLQNFIAEKGLKFRVNKDMGVCIVFKP
jgi:hypothetical protein